MREKAIVVETMRNHARVEIRKSAACDGCKGCSVGREGKPLKVWAKDPIGVKVGQIVEIELSAKTFLSATLIAYGIPLLAFLLGVFLAFKFSKPLNIFAVEPFALFVGLALMSISYLMIHLLTGSKEVRKKYSSRIIRIM